MKQKIKVVLARTVCDPLNTWSENKVVEIEVDNPELERDEIFRYHVVGEIQQIGVESDETKKHFDDVFNKAVENLKFEGR